MNENVLQTIQTINNTKFVTAIVYKTHLLKNLI